MVGHVAGKGHLVRDDDHGGVLLGERADDLEHLAGQLGVERGGRLVKAQDVRLEGERAGDRHALLLAARELVGVVAHAALQTHLAEQLDGMVLDLLVDLALVLLIVRPLLGEQQARQHDVFQRRVLREQVERLEHHAEVQAALADLSVRFAGMVGGVEQRFAVDDDLPGVRRLEEVQAAQQRCLARTRGADDGQRLAALERKADVVQHLGGAEALVDVVDFENRHSGSLLTRGNSPFSSPASQTAVSGCRRTAGRTGRWRTAARSCRH